MAEWTDRPELADKLVESWLKERTPYRTPGIHVSDVIQSLVVNTPGLASVRDDIEGPTLHAMWALGLAWEDIVLSSTPWPAAALTLDGITGSPDALNPVEKRIDECKLTWKSARRPPKEDWRYTTQIKAYCWMFKVHNGRFFIFYVNGSYSPPMPRPSVFDVTFTHQELWENWNMLTNHRAWMEKQEENQGGLTVGQ